MLVNMYLILKRLQDEISNDCRVTMRIGKDVIYFSFYWHMTTVRWTYVLNVEDLGLAVDDEIIMFGIARAARSAHDKWREEREWI